MTRPVDPFERVRDANPVDSPVMPDWPRISRLVADEAQASVARAPSPERWRRNRSMLGGALGAFALLAALAAVVVLALAPSGGSSDFLARAAAALAPASGTVLYERWETTLAPERFNHGRDRAATFGPDQLWIEADHPRRYRTVLMPRSGPAERPSGGVDLAYTYGVTVGYAGSSFNRRNGRSDTLSRLARATFGRPLELAGTAEAAKGTSNPGGVLPTLAFMPAHELLRAQLRVTLGPMLPGPHDQAIESGADPAQVLRDAITEGRARVTGNARIAGQTVQRISIRLPRQLPADAPPLPPGHPALSARPEAQAYVQPRTLHPVEIVFGPQTYRFLAYEYLPATTANLALTDIRAQHPHAMILNKVLQASRPRAR